MTGKFSIVLPVRNGGAYVRECVGSILAQKYTDFNCLVLDNHSTDDTREWIESLQDPRILIFPSDKPLSIEQNWARVKDLEKSEFMTMIGHDDILAENYLIEMDRLIQLHPDASLYQAHFKYIDKDGHPFLTCFPMDEVQRAHEFLACQMMETIHSTGTGYMMRSADFDAVGGMPTHYPNLIYSDFHLWLRLMKKSYKATTLAECFYYRAHMSVSRVTNGEQYFKAFHEYITFLHLLKMESQQFELVLSRYGKKYLLKMCESLAHRILKTPYHLRSSSIKSLLEIFKGYAQLLVPDESFDPLEVKRIKYALMLDKSAVTRNLFNAVNNWIKKS